MTDGPRQEDCVEDGKAKSGRQGEGTGAFRPWEGLCKVPLNILLGHFTEGREAPLREPPWPLASSTASVSVWPPWPIPDSQEARRLGNRRVASLRCCSPCAANRPPRCASSRSSLRGTPSSRGKAGPLSRPRPPVLRSSAWPTRPPWDGSVSSLPLLWRTATIRTPSREFCAGQVARFHSMETVWCWTILWSDSGSWCRYGWILLFVYR